MAGPRIICLIINLNSGSLGKRRGLVVIEAPFGSAYCGFGSCLFLFSPVSFETSEIHQNEKEIFKGTGT